MELDLEISELIPGEVYFTKTPNRTPLYIGRYPIGEEGHTSKGVAYIKKEYADHWQYCGPEGTSSCFNNNFNKFRKATHDEKMHLLACIKADSFIPFDKIEEDVVEDFKHY